MAQQFGLGDILSEVAALARAHAGVSLGFFTAIAAMYCAIDLLVADGVSAIAGVIVMVFLQYQYLERLLADYLPSGQTQRRYMALFASGMLGGLGILVGLICLIIPGLLLMAGWSAASPFVVVAGKSGFDSLSASWRATEGVRVPLALLLAAFWALVIAGVLGVAFWPGATEVVSTAETVIANVLTSISSVGSWLIGAAIFRLAAPRSEDLQSVFA